MSDPTALPLYVQISEMLIREIASGRLIDGERLPPERQMAMELNTSVGTLRKSLGDLERRGLLERLQGSGNYVRHRPDVGGVYAFFRLEHVDGGGLPTAELLDVTRMKKPEDLPKFGSAQFGHRIRRLRRLSGAPSALEEIWLDGKWADGIRKDDLSESLYLFYRTSLNLWIARAEDRVGVSTVPEWRVDAFEKPIGAACGFIERWASTPEGSIAEYSRTWFDQDKARYVARLK